MNALQTVRQKLIALPDWTSPVVTLLLELERVPSDKRPMVASARRMEVEDACEQARDDLRWLEHIRSTLIEATPIPSNRVPFGF